MLDTMSPMRGDLIIGAASLFVAAALSPGVASATPENPHGDDFIAVAVSPGVLEAVSYGGSGTQQVATTIALDGCKARSQGQPCYVAAVIQYGCVSFLVHPPTQAWAGGKGPDPDAATLDAARKLPTDVNPAEIVGGSQCSDPMTPP